MACGVSQAPIKMKKWEVEMSLRNKYRAILRKNITRKNRKRLNNHDFTIICNNCVGGVIYSTLGEKFNTPTINLFFANPEQYIDFCSNLEYYLACDFIKKENAQYPIGLLDGKIEVHFMHYNNYEAAIKKWKERRQRVNFNNLYMILVQRDGCTEDNIADFLKIPFENKIVLAANKHTENEKVICIPDTTISPEEVRDLCAYKSKFTGKRYIDDFDYVSWLNRNDDL